MATCRERLALVPGGPVAYRQRPAVGAVALDLAIQSLGRAPVPIAPAEGAEELEQAIAAGAASWAAVEPEEPPTDLPAGLPAIAVAAQPPAVRRGEAVPDLGSVPAPALPVRVGAVWAAVTPDALATSCEVLAARLGSSRRRRIALVVGALADPGLRLWQSWALRSGAALVLVGATEQTAWSLAWSRPTVACLPVEALEPVRAAMQSAMKPRRLRRQLARLEHLLVAGPPPAAEVAAWGEVGVTVEALPEPLPSCGIRAAPAPMDGVDSKG